VAPLARALDLHCETQFFDWLITSIKSVNQILENTPIIFETNYIYPNSLNTTSINFKKL
jgi:hypothetical protein